MAYGRQGGGGGGGGGAAAGGGAAGGGAGLAYVRPSGYSAVQLL